MRNSGFWWIVAGVMVLLDFYVFQAIKTVTGQISSDKTRLIIQTGYWIISVCSLFALLSFPYIQAFHDSVVFRNYVFAIVAGLFFAKLTASIIFLSDDIRRLSIWGMHKVSSVAAEKENMDHDPISRSVFISWLGLGIGTTFLGTLLNGFRNKYNYQLHKVKLAYNNLPPAFKGLKIIHISDIHSGSLQDKQAVQHGINMILEQKPDLILFTGDLVNDRHEEMLDLMDVFGQLKAPLGVFSSLGNHDYGDYTNWPSEAAKQQNLESLKAVHASMGWRLLLNEHVAIERNGEKIALLGVENWGKGRFAKYGKLNKTYAGAGQYPFKILMSHDPSHWDAEVRPQYPDIDLTLSGHTHGFQFGLENPYFKWSPSKYLYKQWAGLYTEGKQQLYVNRGFGFLGYPGRVGIMPEITLIELV